MSVSLLEDTFQSPPPMREATSTISPKLSIEYISIPASHAGGDRSLRNLRHRSVISIPASHAGGDVEHRIAHQVVSISIPASHAGGDVQLNAQGARYEVISIPASHAGGDQEPP